MPRKVPKTKKRHSRHPKPRRPKTYHKKDMKAYKKQTTRTGSKFSKKRDQGRTAKRPGYRRSKSGKSYYEARRNRSDARGSRI